MVIRQKHIIIMRALQLLAQLYWHLGPIKSTSHLHSLEVQLPWLLHAFCDVVIGNRGVVVTGELVCGIVVVVMVISLEGFVVGGREIVVTGGFVCAVVTVVVLIPSHLTISGF